MARTRPLQPLDVATGPVSGTLAATFFALATLAAVSGGDQPSDTVVIDSAVSSSGDR